MYRNIEDVIRELEATKERVEKLERLHASALARGKRLRAELDRISRLYPEGPTYELGSKLRVPPKPGRLKKRARSKK